MQKWKSYKGFAICLLVLEIVVSGIRPIKVSAAEETEVRNINLNINGEIAGVNNPSQLQKEEDKWDGCYLYFGSYPQGDYRSFLTNSAKKPIKWRILDNCTDAYTTSGTQTMLLMSDVVLDRVLFNDTPQMQQGKYYSDTLYTHLANEYKSSKLHNWLNSVGNAENGFYKSAFTEAEQMRIAESSIAYGKVYTLSEAELKNSLYGFYSGRVSEKNVSTSLSVTEYVKDKQKLDKAVWWLRSTSDDMGQMIDYVNEKGTIVQISSDSSIGVVPALNLQLSSVAFVSESDMNKKDKFKVTKKSDSNTWNVTLFGGEGFSVTEVRKATNNGNTIVLDVDNLGTPSNGVDYSQLSAMLVDRNGTVVCYGKIRDEAVIGEVSVKIPGDIADGVYVLKVFAEDVNSSKNKPATDYASNMVEVIVKYSEDSAVVSTPTPTPKPSATPTPKPSATPTPKPSATPTPEPSATPTPEPSATPTPEPSATPTPEPSATPTPEPSATPTPEPSAAPTATPNVTPTTNTKTTVSTAMTDSLENSKSLVQNDVETNSRGKSSGLTKIIIISVFVLLIIVGFILYLLPEDGKMKKFKNEKLKIFKRKKR